MRTRSQFYRVDRHEIAFLKFVFEACEGIAVMKTLDAQSGRIELMVPPGCEDDVETILAGLTEHILIEPLADDAR